MITNRLCLKEIRTNEESRTIEGYAAIFDSPSEDLGFIEILHRGAITEETINKSDVLVRFNHSDEKVLARSKYGKGSLKLEVDEIGLRYSFQAPNTSLGNEVLEYIHRGDVDSSSFAFSLSKDEDAQRWHRENGVLYRDIYKVERLYDVAPVFSPAYAATTCDARSKEMAMVEEIIRKLDEEVKEEEIKDEVEEKPIEETPTENTTEETVNNEETVEEDNTENKRNNNIINSTKTMNKEFRLIKAIRDVANNRSLDEVSSAVIAEGAEELRKSGLSYGGQIQLPSMENRATITVASEGDDVVATELYNIVEPLRAKNVLVGAGAKFITGLVGDVQIPIMDGGNVTWEGEVANASDGAGAFSHITLSPKRLTAYVDISKQFLNQDGLGAENLIRQDIINAVNSKLEASILSDFSGSTTQPKGLLAYSGVINAGTVSAYSGLTDLEATVEEKNIYGDMAYILAPKAKGGLRAMAKSTKNTQLVMEGGEVDGTKAFSTSHLSGKDFVYGDFSNLVIGSWGAIDLTVDPYTKAAAGQVRLVVNAYFDFQPIRDIAFGKGEIA